jgi:spore coat polysaccharide biosynthesis predicted glycosyltransferase SpsG
LLEAPKLLFIPVSGAYGMGEFARSLAIARAATRRWPAAEIHFLISRQAPYAGTVPFAVTLLPSSPTLNSPQVIQKILEWRPDVVVFDNAGRSAQLRAAQRIQARIVYISARARQRRKAFRMRWMRCIDEHWIAYPEFVAGKLNWLERLKIDVLKRPMVRFLDVIAASGPDENPPFEQGTYALFVPGGGTGHPGADDAVQLFVAAARALAAQGAHCVVVGVLAGEEAQPSGSMRMLAPVPQPQLMQLMRGARLLVTNGGSTLLQGIAMGCACIGVPIAKDQPQRIERCVATGVARSAPLAAVPMTEAAATLWQDETARRLLVQRAAALRLKDGIEVALQGLERLLAEATGA